jgi:hypothetical protein
MQIVNGRLKRAMHVLLHLIGHAVEFVGLLKELKKSTKNVEKVRKLCGVLLSRRGSFKFFLTQEDYN